MSGENVPQWSAEDREFLDALAARMEEDAKRFVVESREPLNDFTVALAVIACSALAAVLVTIIVMMTW